MTMLAHFLPRLRTDSGLSAALAAQVRLAEFARRTDSALEAPFVDVSARDVSEKAFAERRRKIARDALTDLEGAPWAAVQAADNEAKVALGAYLGTLRKAIGQLTGLEIARAERLLNETFGGSAGSADLERVKDFREKLSGRSFDHVVAGMLLPSDHALRIEAEALFVDAANGLPLGFQEAYAASGSIRLLTAAGILPQQHSNQDAPSIVLRRMQIAAELVAASYAEMRSALQTLARATSVRRDSDGNVIEHLDATQLLIRAHDADRNRRLALAEQLGITVPATASTGRGSMPNPDGTRTTTPSLSDVTLSLFDRANARIMNAREGGAA